MDPSLRITEDESAVRARTIAVDFDGVLMSFEDLDEDRRLRCEGQPEPGAKEALNRLRGHGYRIVIHSSRAWEGYGLRRHAYLAEMRDWLVKNEIPFDHIHDTEGKPPAIAYIDDLALRYTGNWREIGDWLIFADDR